MHKSAHLAEQFSIVVCRIHSWLSCLMLFLSQQPAHHMSILQKVSNKEKQSDAVTEYIQQQHLLTHTNEQSRRTVRSRISWKVSGTFQTNSSQEGVPHLLLGCFPICYRDLYFLVQHYLVMHGISFLFNLHIYLMNSLNSRFPYSSCRTAVFQLYPSITTTIFAPSFHITYV